MDKAMHSEIPQWVIDYNNAGHQSSAGRAVNILMKENQSLRSEIQRLQNDLDDALGIKNGNGPTALSRLSNELQKQKELTSEAVEIMKWFCGRVEVGEVVSKRTYNKMMAYMEKNSLL